MVKPLESFLILNSLYFFLPCTFDFSLSFIVCGTTVVFNIRPIIIFYYFRQSVCPTALCCKPLTLYTTFNPNVTATPKSSVSHITCVTLSMNLNDQTHGERVSRMSQNVQFRQVKFLSAVFSLDAR